nr:TetR/AcrR family transcriptional regulator [Streptomyces sp. SID8356]
MQSALELFWRRGYEATSIADLVEHLGIGRASIYATFGNKHELYLKALDRYAEGRDAVLLDELSQPGDALPAVRAVVRRFATEAVAEDVRLKGCLVTNTAVELAPHEGASARRVGSSWDRFETLLHSALVRAQAQGELAEGRDPRALARMVLVLLQGVRVVGKASGDTARVRDAVEQALSLLE